ncbi:hypothetical protein QUB05_03060 [Microcoleus sp. F10-C6]
MGKQEKLKSLIPTKTPGMLKARRKKSGANLADMELVLEILGTDGSEI